MTLVDYGIVFVFMALMFYVGSRLYRWIGSSDDYYLAGRQLTPFVLAAVIAATNVNLYSFIGQAGIAYQTGLPIIWQTWTGNMAMVFSGLFVIPIFRRLRIRTIPEFLELRYSKSVRTFVAILWILRLSFWLGVVLYAAAIAAQPITGLNSFTAWILILSVVVIMYTVLGGMWSVALTDVIQFVLMLAGALIILPLVMEQVGWWPGLKAALPEGALTLVQQEGTYNWKFILAIFLLGIEWSCVDQGLLQRAFGAENTRSVARGLVLAAIITTPFALLWNIPGLAARVLYPDLANADMAIPTLISSLVPHVVLGFVVVGLLSSQLSTISGNLNGVATIFTSDIYENILNRKATEAQIIRVARIVSLLIGLLMIVFAYLVPLMGGAVNAYLTIIAVMDMPLFIIAVVYGLLWKRANWQGAIGGYLLASFAGGIGQFYYHLDFNMTTFITAGIALLVTPLISLVTVHVHREQLDSIWRAKQISDEEISTEVRYHILPITRRGQLGLYVLAAGFVIFLAGVMLGSSGNALASPLAVTGMVVYFAGGAVRAFND